MVERTLADEIISIVHSEANNNPLPVKCTIHETYPNGLIDVLLENGNIVTYLPVIGSPRVGDTGVLLYLDDEKNNQIIITNGGAVGSGGSNSTGWQNVSFLADYTNYPNDSLKIRRIGNIVEINGSWTSLKDKPASLTEIPFATIDEEFRPESEVYVRQQGRGMNTYLLVIKPNGNVYWSKYGTSSSSNLTASYKYICHALWTVNGGAVGGGGSTGTGGEVDLSNYIQKSSTSGLVKNDGSIDTTSYLSSLPIHTHMKSEITDFTHTHSIDDVAGLQTTLNEKANTSHTHTTSEITDFPVIPDVSNYIQKSSIAGFVKNDGSIDSNDYVTKDNLSIKYSNEIPTEVDPSEPYSLCIVKSSNGYDVYSIQEPSTGGSGEWVKSATIPSDFAISSHNHNDLYYSKHEVDELSAQINVKLWVDNYNPIKGDKILFSMQITKSNELLKNYVFELVINDGTIVPLTTDDKGTCTYEYVCSQEGLNKFTINNTSLYLVVTRDSGWQNVNFLAGYEGNPAQGNVTYRRKGDVVTIKGGWYPLQDYSATNARVAFATIPEEIAPSGNLYTVQVGASMNKYLLTITPDGTLSWSKYGTTTNLNLPKNTRMTLTVTYII